MQSIFVPTLDELAVEFERASADYDRNSRAAEANPDDQAADRAADEACIVLSEVCLAIAQLPPQTVGHLRLKARAFLWCEHPDRKEPTQTSERLAYQLATSLVHGFANGVVTVAPT